MLSTITSLGILSLSLSFCTSDRTIGQVERLTDQIVPETAVAAQFTYVNPYSPTPIFESPIAGVGRISQMRTSMMKGGRSETEITDIADCAMIP